mmetsp:Transcript_38086/g.84841  ORF Transcript_38086/g.84841 Transcript_38086/m.84841 type:complete len:252 (-) Transcript_38086:1314-2069(-)
MPHYSLLTRTATQLTATPPLIMILSTTRPMRSDQSVLSMSLIVSRMWRSGFSLLDQPSSTSVVTTTVDTVLFSVTLCWRSVSIMSLSTMEVWVRMVWGSSRSNMSRRSSMKASGSLHVCCSDSLRMECAICSPSCLVSALKKSTMFFWSSGLSSAIMPASSSTSFGWKSNTLVSMRQIPRHELVSTSLTRMLPGCRSAWQKLSFRSICRYRLRPMSASRWRRVICCCVLMYDVMREPSSNDSTSTSEETRG